VIVDMRAQVEMAIRRERLVAILRGVPAHHVAEMGESLLAGGIHLMEVALSTPDALDGLARLVETVGDRGCVGAGTVVTPELGRQALARGAQFFVTPHLIPEVSELAVGRGIAIISGVLTPLEISQARTLGSNIVKLFPASVGGPGYVKALKGPYPDLEVLVTGGVGPANLGDFLRAGALGGGIGGALTELDWRRPDFAKTRELAASLVRIVREAADGPEAPDPVHHNG
jgi:2-dehydro-3-deoxyphosphogluconate aldolase/(4S)-4-hydroxy-2-oxoglutarate aldolase